MFGTLLLQVFNRDNGEYGNNEISCVPLIRFTEIRDDQTGSFLPKSNRFR